MSELQKMLDTATKDFREKVASEIYDRTFEKICQGETREITMGEPFMRLERGEIDFAQYVDEIRASMPNGEHIDVSSLRNIWMNSTAGEMPAVSLLKSLQSNYQVWVISNTTEAHIISLKSKFSTRDFPLEKIFIL